MNEGKKNRWIIEWHVVNVEWSVAQPRKKEHRQQRNVLLVCCFEVKKKNPIVYNYFLVADEGKIM